MEVQVIPIPIEVVFHSQFRVLFPFPWDSQWWIRITIGDPIPMHISIL